MESTAVVAAKPVDHEISAKAKRLLQVRRGKRVVYGQHGAGAVSQVGDGADIQDLQQGVRGRLNPDDRHVSKAVRVGLPLREYS